MSPSGGENHRASCPRVDTVPRCGGDQVGRYHSIGQQGMQPKFPRFTFFLPRGWSIVALLIRAGHTMPVPHNRSVAPKPGGGLPAMLASCRSLHRQFLHAQAPARCFIHVHSTRSPWAPLPISGHGRPVVARHYSGGSAGGLFIRVARGRRRLSPPSAPSAALSFGRTVEGRANGTLPRPAHGFYEPRRARR